jgi:hypothetical protein
LLFGSRDFTTPNITAPTSVVVIGGTIIEASSPYIAVAGAGTPTAR